MHKSVLLNEVLEYLNLRKDSLVVDCTLGYAGHSSEILKVISDGYLYAFDQDSHAISYSSQKLSAIDSNYKIIKSNFCYLKEELNKCGVSTVDGILFDLGVSSPQLDEASRGFSFHQDAKLDMRMDQNQDISAYEVVNNYQENDLARIIFQYGEEKYAKNIAKNIVRERTIKPIETTFELVEIIKKSMPKKDTFDKNPARRTFQAIRIEVNHELDILEDSLKKALSLLNIGGRMVVITFHSLEDRIVKNVFKEVSEVDKLVKGLPEIPDAYLPKFKLVEKKAISPSDFELLENRRSRSSHMRVIERIR